MVGNWKKEVCATQPDEIQIIASNVYMERRNIVEKQSEATEQQTSYTYWECESREIGISDYNLIKALGEVKVEDAIDDAIDSYTIQLIEEGVL